MGSELIKAAQAANRDVPDDVPAPFQDCRDVVHIAIFFDGTGNNKDMDLPDKKWSNIARMYEAANLAAMRAKEKSVYAIYVSGVGTPYNGDAVSWLEKADVWMEDGFLGMGAGAGGDRRLDHGSVAVNKRLRDVLIENAKKLGGDVAQYAVANSKKSFGDVNAALSRHRLIKAINLSIFGFSRGAALARAFSNRVLDDCKMKGPTLTYQGYPLRLNFMGLFDTVASFGLPAQNIRTPFDERELIVSPMVERCVHYVAGHELRFSFPVDLIRKNGRFSRNWLEKVFPGVHSDVGGGYGPGDQGVDNNLARVPMREMMSEALSSGVRMLSYDGIKKIFRPLFDERFECKAATEEAYARYTAACAISGQTVEQQITAHMKQFYSAYGTMFRKGVETAGARSRKASAIKSFLGPAEMASEVAVYRSARAKISLVRFGGSSNLSYAQYVKAHAWQLAAWDTQARNDVVEFFARFVHDSKVDFLLNAEPFSYFSQRGIEESSVSIWQTGGNWLGEKAFAISSTISDAAEAAKASVVGTYDGATRLGKEAVASGERAVGEMENSRRKIYEDGVAWIERQVGLR
jgi:uncharacterized protein (DUF2235 family)